MPVPLIPCRNTVTGATADIPETALRHLGNWVPADTPPTPLDEPRAAAEPAGAEPTATGAATAAPDRPAGTPAGKSKAAKAATTSNKEG